MHIHIKLYGDLKKYALDGLSQFSMTIPQRSTLADIYERLAIPDELHTSLINGLRAEHTNHLEENDIIVLMPPIAGG